MDKDQKRGLLVIGVIAAIAVVGIVLISLQVSYVKSTGGKASYPLSTLTREQGFSTYRPSSLLPMTLQCPNLPYEVDVLSEVTGQGDVIYGHETTGDVYISIEEADTYMPTDEILEGSISSVGSSYVQIPSVKWHPMIEDEGYLNGYMAEYGSGYMEISQKVNDDIQFAVYYRISFPSSNTDFVVYAYTKELAKIENAKSLADSTIYTLRSLESVNRAARDAEDETYGTDSTENATEDGTELTVLPEDSPDTELSEEDKNLQEIDEFMNSMTIVEDGSVKGESYPRYTDLSDIHLKDDYVKMDDEDNDSYVMVRDYEFEPGAGRDAEFVFVWEPGYNNTSPQVVTVTDSNGRHYEEYNSDFTSMKDGVIAIRVPNTIDGKYYLHYVVASDIGNPDSYVWLTEELADRLEEYDGDYTPLRSDLMNHRHDNDLWQ